MEWHECPSYDGIYDGHGPCWTCQGVREQCPLHATDDDADGERVEAANEA